MAEGLTGQQLIAAARRSGYKISGNTLKRLRDGGLIPRPQPRPTKGIIGIPQTYPDGTLEQLLAVCQLRREAWRFDELRILVWWHGFWVDRDQLRRSLKAVIEEDPQVQMMRTVFEEADQDPFEAAHLVLERDKSNEIRDPVIRLFLRRLAGNRDDLYTVAYVLLVLMFGGEPEWDSTDVGLDHEDSGEHFVEASPRELLERAMGIDRLLSDDPGSGPVLKARPDIAQDMARLRDIGAFNLLSPSEAFEKGSDRELDQARERVAIFFDLLPVAAKAIEAMLGKDFAGMGFFSAASQKTGAFQRASLVRYGLLLPKLVDDEAIQELSAPLLANNPVFHAVLQVTQAFPGYRKYLTPTGVAQLDTLAAEELSHFRSQLSEFMTQNPGIAQELNQASDADD